VKIHTSRSTSSTINTFHNESLSHSALPFSGTRMIDGGILTSASGTVMTDGSTWMFGGDTLTSDNGTLTANGSTRMVDGGTLTVGDGTLTVGGGTLRSVAPSQALLDIYIVSWPSRPGSTVARMARHLHHITAKSSRQHRRQHDSASISRHGPVALATSSPA
jgi:hypothetical protein